MSNDPIVIVGEGPVGEDIENALDQLEQTGFWEDDNGNGETGK